MKTLKLIIVGLILIVSSSMQSQVSVNVNVGRPPAWGPAVSSNVEYYYLPDVQAYYDIRASKFIYFGNGQWVRSNTLPGQYRNYNLYNGYKVVLNDYHGSRPYTNFNSHKVKYYKGYKGKPQKIYGNQHDNRGDNQGRGNDNQGRGNDDHNKGKENKGHGKNK